MSILDIKWCSTVIWVNPSFRFIHTCVTFLTQAELNFHFGWATGENKTTLIIIIISRSCKYATTPYGKTNILSCDIVLSESQAAFTTRLFYAAIPQDWGWIWVFHCCLLSSLVPGQLANDVSSPANVAAGCHPTAALLWWSSDCQGGGWLELPLAL